MANRQAPLNLTHILRFNNENVKIKLNGIDKDMTLGFALVQIVGNTPIKKENNSIGYLKKCFRVQDKLERHQDDKEFMIDEEDLSTINNILESKEQTTVAYEGQIAMILEIAQANLKEVEPKREVKKEVTS